MNTSKKMKKTPNMKQVLLPALVSTILWTACQKEQSASNLVQQENTRQNGAVMANIDVLRKIPTLVVTSDAANVTDVLAKRGGGKGPGKPGSDTTPPSDTTTTTTDTVTIVPTPTDTIIPVPPPSTPIPASYALVMPPVGYQGSEGSCVAWAVAYGARSYVEYKKTNASTYSYATNMFSPEYVFNQAKLSTNCGSSAMITSMNLLVEQGVCTWQTMPYSYLDGCSQLPSASQTNEAIGYKIASYAKVSTADVATIKTMIASNKPVPFTCVTDYAFTSARAGYIWTTYGGFNGAHAMVLCGYDDAKHAYKAYNSWGTSWGDAGYIWIDYDLLPVISYEAYVMNL